MSDLRDKIMDIYDVRPSTAEHIQNIVETIVMIAENEYTRGHVEVSEDAVSRGWVLKELNSESEKDYPSFRKVMDKIEDAKRLSIILPAEPKQRTGKWLNKDYKSQCNCCRRVYPWQKYDRIYEEKFCPNCGASMKG